jgi:PAS domain S-box-containing protein
MTLKSTTLKSSLMQPGTIKEISYEKRLLQTGALQSAIFNSENFSSIATDAMGVIQIFNVGAERMLGYSASEVLNKITPADISDTQEVINRAKELSEEFDRPIAPGFEALVFKAARCIEDIYELTYIRKDGSRFPAIVSVTALRDAQDEVIGYLLIGTDNTARQHADDKLWEAAQYARSLIEASLDPLVTINTKGKITDVNEASIKVTGVAREILIGTDFSDYFTEPEKARQGYREAFSKGSVTDYPLTIRHEDGHLTNVLYNASVYKDEQGQVLGVFAAARDITARIQIEEEREQLYATLQEKNAELECSKAVAEKANLAKSNFLSSMSHELRTPLNAILGFAQLLENGRPAPTDAQAVRLQQILKAGWYLLDLINEILDLAVIESGRLILSREPVLLMEVMSESRAMIEAQALKCNVILNILPFDETWYVNGDRTRIKQVLINLLTNAIKYNHEHGSVIVECAQLGPDRIRISIQDNGAGLSEEKLAQLFEPFNRLGQENGSEEGTGIGLVVTKQLINLMGGAIGVVSKVGFGSEFWIELIKDITPKPVTGHTIPIDLIPQLLEVAEMRTLLYVEDNPANLMLVEQIIEGHPNLHMLSAHDGHHGIELAQTHLPDVILMDINLPGISGIDALKSLRENPRTASIPVLAISANAMPRDIQHGMEAGFLRYLTKPIKIKEFIEALDLALEKDLLN